MGFLRAMSCLDVNSGSNMSVGTRHAVSKVGKLKMLKVFKLNGNKIQTLPGDIGNCTKLEKILAGENSLMVPSASSSSLWTVLRFLCLRYCVRVCEKLNE